MKEYKGFEFEIDSLNGEAKIFNDDGQHVDTVDLWDLMQEFDRQAEARVKKCIADNQARYKANPNALREYL